MYRGAISALALLALASCGWGWPNARYIPTKYTGTWAVTLTSEQCGEDALQTYTATGGMAFSAYDNRYYFDFRHGIQDRTAEGAAQQSVRFTSRLTGESTVLEAPEFRIEFESSDRGRGVWRAQDCQGETVLVKLRD